MSGWKKTNKSMSDIPFYNLPEKVQAKLDKTYGQYWIDYLKSLDQDHLDLWLHVSGVEL